jgi:hypothetical protein
MRYGFYLPLAARPPRATAFSRWRASGWALHSAMVADHIVFPVESPSRRCETQATLAGKPPSFATVSVPWTPSARSANLIAGDGTKNGFPAPNKEPTTTRNDGLTGNAPYKFESRLLRQGVCLRSAFYQPPRALGQRRDGDVMPGSAASAKRISAERECEPVFFITAARWFSTGLVDANDGVSWSKVPLAVPSTLGGTALAQDAMHHAAS